MGPDNGMELKYALRSIEANFAHDNYEIIVLGSKPDWLTNVTHLSIPRIGERPMRAFADQILKLYTALAELEVTNDFVWTYDDVYFTQKVTLDDIKSLKFALDLQSINEVENIEGGANWRTAIKDALTATESLRIFETHLPRWYNKSKMLKLIDRYMLISNPMVLATLYYNTYFKQAQAIDVNKEKGIRFMVRSMFDIKTLEKHMRKHKFTNNNPSTYNDVLKYALDTLFPIGSKYEASSR